MVYYTSLRRKKIDILFYCFFSFATFFVFMDISMNTFGKSHALYLIIPIIIGFYFMKKKLPRVEINDSDLTFVNNQRFRNQSIQISFKEIKKFEYKKGRLEYIFILNNGQEIKMEVKFDSDAFKPIEEILSDEGVPPTL